MLWPLFARAPRHWFLENFLLSAPGVQSVLFFVALRWAPRPFGGARAKKKKHHPGCFFFAPAPGKGRGRRSPVPARGQSKKKKTHHPGCFFFAAGRGRTGVVFFFLLWPRPDAHSLTVGWGDFGKARVVFFFWLRPRRVFLDNNKKNVWGTTSGLKRPRPRAGAGAKKKKHPGWCFFFCSGPVPASNGASPSLAFRRGRRSPVPAQRGFSFPCLSPGPEQKKKHPGWCFFAAAPRGRSLTHCGPGWRCLPLGGVVFFFLLRPRPDRGGVFFLLWPRPDAHSLTVGWGDFGVFFFQGPGGVFFLAGGVFFLAAAPPGLFRQ